MAPLFLHIALDLFLMRAVPDHASIKDWGHAKRFCFL
jgi:hypothetical protein